MTWFTRFSRPARKGLPPGGRNHIRASSRRTLCGIRLQRWILYQTVIVDSASRKRAYPDCARCRHLYAKRLAVAAEPAAATPVCAPAVPLAA